MKPVAVLACAVAAVTIAILAVEASAQAVWSRIPPPIFGGPTMVADSVHHRMLFFGSVNQPQVWALSMDPAGQWSDLMSSGAPEIPTYRSAIADPDGDRLLYFSQTGPGNYELPLGVPNPVWTPLNATGVGVTDPAGAVYDPVRKRVIAWSCSADTSIFQLDLTVTPPAWSRIPSTGDPTGQCMLSAIYDPLRNRVVTLDAQAHPWQLTLEGLARWSRIFPLGTAPVGGLGAYSVTRDPFGDRMLVLQKARYTQNNSISLWALNLSGTPVWQMVTDFSHTPNTPVAGDCAYDPVGGRFVSYCSEVSGALAVDALALNGPPEWTRLQPMSDVAPSAGQGGERLRVDPVRDRLLWFENYTFTNGASTRLWARSLVEPSAWVLLPRLGTPPPGLVGSDVVYDPPRDRFLYFGGHDGSIINATNSVWSLDPVSLTWTLLAPTGSPPSARTGAAADYDPVRDRLMIFGGKSVSGRLNDVWALSLAGTPAWSPVIPTGILPTVRENSFLAYDPRRDQMLLFGGSGDQDAWTLTLDGSSAWTLLMPEGVPGPEGPAFFDAERDRLVTAKVDFSSLSGLSELTTWGSIPTVLGERFLNPGPAAFDARRDRWIAWDNGLRTLSFGAPEIPSVRVPDATTWTVGAFMPLTYWIRNPYDYAESFAWTLSSERNWPGLPKRGVLMVNAADSASVMVSVRAPDTAAVGLNLLTFRATSMTPLVSVTGAHHLHDATTAAALALSDLAIATDHVVLRWWSSEDAGEGVVERREGNQARREVGRVLPIASLYVFDDRSVLPGARYTYRLRVGAGTDESVSPEVDVQIPFRQLSLSAPNPADGIEVSYTLPANGPARLEVVDVTGRRVASHEVLASPGEARRFELAAAGTLAPGVYLVRLSQGASIVTRRVVVVR